MSTYAAFTQSGDLICDGTTYEEVEDACLDMGYRDDEFYIAKVTA